MEPTLESIALRKAEVLDQIRHQQGVMSDLAHDIFAPLTPATNKVSAAMRAVNTGMAIVDGTLLGMRLTRTLQRLFRKKQ